MSKYSWKDPFYKTPIINGYMTHYKNRPISPHKDDVIYAVSHLWVNRPDLMALDIYGDPDLWMAIPLRNKLQDPIFDMVLGKELIVPSLEHVIKTFR